MKAIVRIGETAAAAADTALRRVGSLARRGRDEAHRLALERTLHRAQRQLGALVYALHKNGVNDEPLVARYIEMVAQAEAALAAHTSRLHAAVRCPICGASADPDAVFCPLCGEKL